MQQEILNQIITKINDLLCPPDDIPVTGGKQMSTGNHYPNEDQIDLSKHVSGQETYAIDPVYTDSSGMKMCKWGVIDIDENSEEGLEKVGAIRKHLHENGIQSAISFSGNKGYHVYVFTEPVPEQIMRKALGKTKSLFQFQGEAIPGDANRCKPAPCLHQVAGNVSYLFKDAPYPENFHMDNLPVGFYEAQQEILEHVEPSSANVLVLFATTEQKTDERGDVEDMVPDLSQNDDYTPPCIAATIENGGCRSFGTYDKNNLFLTSFCQTKGLGSEKRRELAEKLANNAESGPVETTKTYNDKIRHFQSIQDTPAVKDKPFTCAYALRGRSELQFQCEQCRVRPPGIKTKSSQTASGNKETLLLEISITHDLIAWFIQSGKPSDDVAPEILPAVGYKSEVNKIRKSKCYIYSILLNALSAGANTEASLANWLDHHLSEKDAFAAFFNSNFEKEYEGPEGKFYAEFKNKMLFQYRKLKSEELVDEETLQENLERAVVLSMRYRVIGQSETLAASSVDLTKDIHTSSSDCTHEIGKILSSSQQGEVVAVEAQAEALIEYIIGGGAARVPTPFPTLNDLLGGGFANGSKSTMVSPPGGGKTTIASQLCDYAASLGIPVIFVSMEMSREQIFVNSIARAGNINSSKILSPYKDIKDSVMDQVAELADAYFQTIGKYLYVVEGSHNTTPARIATMVSKARADLNMPKKEPFLVVIDYEQLLNTGIEAIDTGPNETQKISELAVRVKQLARDSNVAVVALSDVTKEEQKNSTKSQELTMNSPRGSNRIAHQADTVIGLYSESSKDDGGKAESDPWDMYIEKVNSSENAHEFIKSLQKAKQATRLGGDSATVFARTELIKNRAGQGRGSQFLLYHRAYHRFEPVALSGQEKAEGRA